MTRVRIRVKKLKIFMNNLLEITNLLKFSSSGRFWQPGASKMLLGGSLERFGVFWGAQRGPQRRSFWARIAPKSHSKMKFFLGALWVSILKVSRLPNWSKMMKIQYPKGFRFGNSDFLKLMVSGQYLVSASTPHSKQGDQYRFTRKTVSKNDLHYDRPSRSAAPGNMLPQTGNW